MGNDGEFAHSQTSVISRNITRISSRSFEHNLQAVTGKVITHNKLKRLNNALDTLYDLIYSQFNEIKAEDYKIIGPQLSLLLNTLKGLLGTYKTFRKSGELAEEVEALGRNYSALYELNYDIKQFRIERKFNPNLLAALNNATSEMPRL